MKRSQLLLAALLCAGILPGISYADNAWFSLNLEFNNPTDFNSGGTWTVVGKADERGFAAAVLHFFADSLNFNPATGFLTPAGFEIEESATSGLRFEIVQGDDFNDRILDIGVIGGTFPSSYVDDPNLILFGSEPDLGSFTGGVEFATGSFDPGDIPTWFEIDTNNDQIPDTRTTDAALFLGPTGPGSTPTVLTTVRYVVPEPATILLAGMSLVGLVIRRW